MYSRKAWGGDLEPFILTKFMKSTVTDDSDPIVSLVIFEWNDEALIGRNGPNDAEVCYSAIVWIAIGLLTSICEGQETICDEGNVEAKLCTEEEIGSFILAPNATDLAKSPIISKAVHLKDPVAVNYPVKATGFYCVSTYAYSGQDYTAVVEFRNAYGELPAAQIAKLPFYGGLTIVYAVIGVYAFPLSLF